MGDAPTSGRISALRLGALAWWLLGGSFFWPFLAILFRDGGGAWPHSFLVDLAPSLAMIAIAAMLFFKARR
jgi:hypothetical protein